ncbi:hypothetical protein HYPSUDRAFT_201590 [Hypholoma sublateritium FD-334 SS-4]|uniref:Uncharacterized protein n=1 Tax=Hypholoma sublateritium (strain FD-334 SS-4) TaxID=945553 RepID=A0A0D2PUN9_HYPSF|nr:hypothetical protein HYPSUDRAFT_201590 [Hypholoma sublateritium FD-334 SS-4]
MPAASRYTWLAPAAAACPAPMPPPAHQPQPRTYSITIRALLALPFRICNPPPAVGKVRSCGVTPLIDVRLEDILDRQHLPPLGLKDFEVPPIPLTIPPADIPQEWLLFVEMSPENLCWQSQTAFHRRTQPPAPTPDDPPPSAHLAMFFARAKQTFFTPGSAYELNLASSLLAPLHRPDAPAHPPPSALRAVERDTYASLDASRARFVHAQLNNVGSRRVLCGILAGVVFCLVGGAAPLAALFARGGARINGICMGVYIFGDLRQLRRFELARPRISRPRPLPPFAPIAQVADAAHSHSAPSHSNPSHTNTKILRSPSAASLATFTSAGSADGIHISPEYFDADAAADDARGDLYAPRPESALDWDGGGLIDLAVLRDTASAYGSEHGSTGSINEEEEEGLSASAIGHGAGGHAPPLQIPRVLPATRSVRSDSSASGASDATVFTGTATFIHAFALSSPDADADTDAPAPRRAHGHALNALGGLGADGDGNGEDGGEEEEDDAALARAIARPAKHQRIAPFDFDGLATDDARGDLYAPRPESALDWDGGGLIDLAVLHGADAASLCGSERSGAAHEAHTAERRMHADAYPDAVRGHVGRVGDRPIGGAGRGWCRARGMHVHARLLSAW